jgi:hypothetical protein
MLTFCILRTLRYYTLSIKSTLFTSHPPPVMKKISLFILSIFAVGVSLAQSVEDFSTVISITDNNMAVVFPAGTLDSYVGGIVQAYVAGVPVSTSSEIAADGSSGVAVIGTDCVNCNPPAPNSILADGGETIDFAILMDGQIFIIIDVVDPPVTYAVNSFQMLNGFTVYGPVVFGCTDVNAYNYDVDANTNDDSCVAYEYGCTDATYLEYSSTANTDNESCITPVVSGCTDFAFVEYSSDANTDDGSCSVLIIEGCTDAAALNYDSEANTYNGSCIYPCPDPNYLEYYLNLSELCTTLITNNGFTAEMFEDPLNTGSNMTIPIPVGLVQQFEGGQIAAFSNGICVGLEVITNDFITMGLWGDDNSTNEVDGLLTGEVPTFVVLYNGGIISLDQYDFTGYQTNGLVFISNFQISDPTGCTSSAACNYISYASIDDGSCFYAEEYYTCEGNCNNDTDNDGICDELEFPGCTEWGYTTYNELATHNDGTCLVTWEEVYGNLTESTTALVDSLENDCVNNITIASATLDSLQNTYNVLEGLSISVDLMNGWNLIGYTSTYEQDAEIALAEVEDIILIFKDNNANVYMPGYSFNGIGNLIPGHGYQIKVSEVYNNFSFEYELILGCTDSLACNYNKLANLEDTNCTYETLTTDCDGNQIVLNYAIGDLVEGGIIFYIDETGQHGLVAALEDITEGSNIGTYGIPEGFEWGCYQQYANGAEGIAIGTGYQNTLDINAQNCQTENGGITAVQAALDYEKEGYTDWFLPSLNELYEMYSTIGNVGLQGNIGGFETNNQPYYWSSSENYNNNAWLVYFNNGLSNLYSKDFSLRVRCVRAF